MKVEELMIGDWVLRDNEPFLVEMLGNKFIQRLWITDGEGYSVLEHSHNLSPIPITPEMLEKNGITKYITDKEKFQESNEFDYSDGRLYILVRYFPDKIVLEIYNDRKLPQFSHFQGTIKYVHELQHALRLCHSKKGIVL